MKKQYFVAVSTVLLIAIFAIAAYFYNAKKADDYNATAQQNESTLVRDYSPTMGNKDAKVTIVEFFDPACETCKSFSPFVKQLMEANPGKIKLVMRYLPLHQGSDEVVKILEAAHLQNKFWETLEEAFIKQSSWAIHHVAQPKLLWKILSHTDFDIEKAKQDINSPTIAQRIQQDIADAVTLKVSKTPGFFVNGKPLIKFGYKELQELVETEIRDNY